MSMHENIFQNAKCDIDWLKYNAAVQESNILREDEEKYLQFKNRILKFEKAITLEDAKNLAKQILPTALEETQFKVGNAFCTVINREDLLRISLNSDKEFICYDFV